MWSTVLTAPAHAIYMRLWHVSMVVSLRVFWFALGFQGRAGLPSSTRVAWRHSVVSFCGRTAAFNLCAPLLLCGAPLRVRHQLPVRDRSASFFESHVCC